MFHQCLPTVLLALPSVAIASAIDRRNAKPAAVVEAQPMITARTPTPPRYEATRTLKNRGIISDLAGDVSSVLGSLGSDVPSYVASGVADFFQGAFLCLYRITVPYADTMHPDFPTGASVQNSLGLNDSQVSALPTQVLNIPGYANWTSQGWNLRFHGNVFKQPNISESKLDDLANVFLVHTSIQELPPAQQSQARNLTAEIFVLQQSNQNVTFDLVPAPTAGASGGQGGGGGVTPGGGNQSIKFPTPTTPEGDFDGFVQINDAGLQPGNASTAPQRLNVYTEGDIQGNATSYLVPESGGLTIVSDIDDILRVTQIYEPSQGLLNTFARPFVPWMNMPDIYANWSKSMPAAHFHYLTTTPEQVTRNYMDFIYKTYPGGSFDDRPLNFSDVSATLSIRKFLLEKIFQTYPKRKFVLIADTSNSDVMRDYPAMSTEFPGQVQCILLRNTTNTDPGDRFPYDTSGFKGLDNSTYMFFVVPVSKNRVYVLL